MDPTALTRDQAALLDRIKSAGQNGLALQKRDPIADKLAAYDMIECRRSDNDSETWWVKAR